MFGDFVKCNNCDSGDMKVTLGTEICPICGSVGTLSWVDEENQEVEVSNSEILEVKPHIYHPGHDAYDAYQCSNCGLYDVAYGSYSRKNVLISEGNSGLNSIGFHFIERDDDGFLKFYNVDNDNTTYVELCPRGILENIVKLYGNDCKYHFSKKAYSDKDFLVSTEYVLNLDVYRNNNTYRYEIHSDNVEVSFYYFIVV